MLNNLIFTLLDDYFKGFPKETTSFFWESEFDLKEKQQLAEMVAFIQNNGYREGFLKSKEDEDFKDILNMATDYGSMVSEGIGYSYLGLYIIAQMSFEPNSSNSFIPEALKSSVFNSCPVEEKELFKLLMLLAVFIQDEKNNNKVRSGMVDFLLLGSINLEILDPFFPQEKDELQEIIFQRIKTGKPVNDLFS